MKTYIHMKLTLMFMVTLLNIAQIGNHTNIHQRINKIYVYKMHYTAIKKKKRLIHATIQINLENFILSKIRES